MPTIDDIPLQNTAPAAGDKLVVRDISAATGQKDKYMLLSQFLLNAAQTISGVQTFQDSLTSAPTSTVVNGMYFNMPAGTTGNAILGAYNGVNAMRMTIRADERGIDFFAFDNGSGSGPFLVARNNNNAATPSAGSFRIFNRGGTQYYFWPDASANFRIGSAAPTSATDTAGTVVGTQTSYAASKHIVEELSPLEEVRARVAAGAAAVRRFTYRSGSFNGQAFEGVVTDEAPAYGMDRDVEHPQGKSLAEITIFGDLLRTVNWLVNEVQALEAKIAKLEDTSIP